MKTHKMAVLVGSLCKGELPLYNEDMEASLPEQWKTIRKTNPTHWQNGVKTTL